jgi:hypothetical protein
MSLGENDELTSRARRVDVFVSYAHRDAAHLDDLLKFLRPSIERFRLDVWYDGKIETGAAWRTALEQRLASCTIAVLLVSADFLASEFVSTVELPALLSAARARGLKLIWIAVGHANYERSPLSALQAANDPARPLEAMLASDRSRAWVQIAKKIELAAYPQHEVDQISAASLPQDAPRHEDALRARGAQVSSVAHHGGISIGSLTNHGTVTVTGTNGSGSSEP